MTASWVLEYQASSGWRRSSASGPWPLLHFFSYMLKRSLLVDSCLKYRIRHERTGEIILISQLPKWVWL